MLKKLTLLVLLLLTTSLTVQAQTERLHIIASFTILADVARNVAGNAADVSTLIPADADPHAFTPAPSDLAAVSDADVVLISGVNLEAGLLESIESAMGDKAPVIASTCVAILPFGADDHADDEATPAPDDEHSARCAGHVGELDALNAAPPSYPTLGRLYALHCAGEHEHDGEAEHEAAPEGDCDPHVWFNPYNVQLWALTIRDTLSELDPANANTYAQNAAAYIEQLEALKAELETTLSALPPEKRVLVTDHEALGYFASTYGFTVVGLVVPGVSTVVEPSAVEIAGLIDTIRAQHVPAIFAGVSVSPALAQQVASDAGAQFYTLYTEALSDEGGDAPTYLDFMRYNMQTIVAALSQGE